MIREVQNKYNTEEEPQNKYGRIDENGEWVPEKKSMKKRKRKIEEGKATEKICPKRTLRDGEFLFYRKATITYY